MIGKEKILSAFSSGTKEFPVVIPYEGIFIRDHWDKLLEYPWWYQFEFDVEKQLLWRSCVIDKLGQDWFTLPTYTPTEKRKRFFIVNKVDGVYCVDRLTGEEKKIEKPLIGGWNREKKIHSINPEIIPDTKKKIDLQIPKIDKKNFVDKDELIERLKERYGKELIALTYIGSPLWRCYSLWGFYNMMLMIKDKPQLVKYACKKYLEETILKIDSAKFLGAEIIWIEECLTDMISPEDFKEINVPIIKEITDYIREKGMKSIYYYCGNPGRKLNYILFCGMDAIAFEESKKNFSIDIEKIAEIINGKCTLLGNLDALFLEKCSEEELKEALKMQIKAGIKNKYKFVISIGSPITPNTSIEKVKLYIDLSHKLGRL